MTLTRNDIEIGKKIFEVNIGWNDSRRPYFKNMMELTIVSNPRYSDFDRSYIVDVTIEGQSGTFKRDLKDKNVLRNETNLNRWFDNKAEALAYAQRIYEKKLTYVEEEILHNAPIEKSHKTGFTSMLKHAFGF